MHRSIQLFALRHLLSEMIRDGDVLEVGSADVNGTIRQIIELFGPRSYVGADLRAGKGVDVVCDAVDLVDRFGPKRFDFVASTEMLEHARDWRGTLDNLKGVLRPGGWLFVTTRSKGWGYHGHPHDYWRFEVSDFESIFPEFDRRTVASDPEGPGVFFLGVRRDVPIATPDRDLHRMERPDV